MAESVTESTTEPRVDVRKIERCPDEGRISFWFIDAPYIGVVYANDEEVYGIVHMMDSQTEASSDELTEYDFENEETDLRLYFSLPLGADKPITDEPHSCYIEIEYDELTDDDYHPTIHKSSLIFFDPLSFRILKAFEEDDMPDEDVTSETIEGTFRNPYMHRHFTSSSDDYRNDPETQSLLEDMKKVMPRLMQQTRVLFDAHV